MTAISSDPEPTAAIDLTHLSRMTLGDAVVEREVLSLFRDQIGTTLRRLRRADRTELAALAHALKGAARGVGAPEIAAAATALEIVLKDATAATALPAALTRLTAAAIDTDAAIAMLLRRR